MKDKVYSDFIEPSNKNGVDIASNKKIIIASQQTFNGSNDLVNINKGQKISSLTEGSTSSISSTLSSTSSSNSQTYNSNFTETNGVDASEIEVEVSKDQIRTIVDNGNNKRDLTEIELKVI